MVTQSILAYHLAAIILLGTGILQSNALPLHYAPYSSRYFDIKLPSEKRLMLLIRVYVFLLMTDTFPSVFWR